jgi:hypothetical protein
MTQWCSNELHYLRFLVMVNGAIQAKITLFMCLLRYYISLCILNWWLMGFMSTQPSVSFANDISFIAYYYFRSSTYTTSTCMIHVLWTRIRESTVNLWIFVPDFEPYIGYHVYIDENFRNVASVSLKFNDNRKRVILKLCSVYVTDNFNTVTSFFENFGSVFFLWYCNMGRNCSWGAQLRVTNR